MTGAPRALFATHFFQDLAGSELVLLELAEALHARGWACDLLTYAMDDPMLGLARAAGLQVHKLWDAPARPFDYDLAWIQTRMEPLLDYAPNPGERLRTLFVFPHLDLRSSMAQYGLVHEPALADACLVTSEEAAAHFTASGMPAERIRLFRNPAPASFFRPAAAPSPALHRLLIVSNHLPEEVRAAAAMLGAAGVETIHWGLGGQVQGCRLTGDAIGAADAVLSIGKTVPYALAQRRPVYLYDHFGGPGWLDDANFEDAQRANFSGRCCRRRLAPDDLAAEVTTGFAAANRFAAALDDAALAPFRLEPQIDALLALLPDAPTAEERRRRLAAEAGAAARESALTRDAIWYFGELWWLKKHGIQARPGAGEA